MTVVSSNVILPLIRQFTLISSLEQRVRLKFRVRPKKRLILNLVASAVILTLESVRKDAQTAISVSQSMIQKSGYLTALSADANLWSISMAISVGHGTPQTGVLGLVMALAIGAIFLQRIGLVTVLPADVFHSN